jgi:transposase, IS5 family
LLFIHIIICIIVCIYKKGKRPETQRKLANLISQQAVRLGYANPAELDVDSTVQEANITYPSLVNLLIKVAIIASRVGKGLNTLGHEGKEQYRVNLTHLKQLALYYFNLKRKEATTEVLPVSTSESSAFQHNAYE